MPITTPRTPTCSWTRCTKSEIYKIVAVYAVTSRESDGDVFHFNQYIDLDDAAEQTFFG